MLKVGLSCFFCPQAGQAFTFLLDEKSKQKNQAKIITGLYAPAFWHAAILAGRRSIHTCFYFNLILKAAL